MALGHAIFGSGEPQLVLRLVDVDERVHHPFATGQISNFLPLGVVQREVLKAAGLGGPKESSRSFLVGLEWVEGLVEVDPDIAALAQQLGTRTALGIEAQQRQLGLLTVFDLGAEGPVGHPIDAGEIAVLLKLGAEIQPRGLAAAGRDHAQANLGIVSARKGIAVRFLPKLSFPLVDDRVVTDMFLVDLGVGDRYRVLGPPVPVMSAHFLLGDVLGEAVHQAGLSRVSGAELLADSAGGGHHLELVALHVSDLRAVGGKARVQGGDALGVCKLAQLTGEAVLVVDVTVERDQQRILFFCPGVAGDAEATNPLTLAPQFLFFREAVLGGPATRRADGLGDLAALEVQREEVAVEAAVRTLQEGEVSIVRAEGEASRDGVAGRGKLGQHVQWERSRCV